MSAQVLQFRQPKVARQSPLTGPRYFCLACDGDQFKVLESGELHCSTCGAHTKNLMAVQR